DTWHQPGRERWIAADGVIAVLVVVVVRWPVARYKHPRRVGDQAPGAIRRDAGERPTGKLRVVVRPIQRQRVGRGWIESRVLPIDQLELDEMHVDRMRVHGQVDQLPDLGRT